jgi:hypothetical protein
MSLFNKEKIKKLENEIEYLRYELNQFKESSKVAYTVYKEQGNTPYMMGMPRSFMCDDFTSQEMFRLILDHLNLKIEKTPEIAPQAKLIKTSEVPAKAK